MRRWSTTDTAGRRAARRSVRTAALFSWGVPMLAVWCAVGIGTTAFVVIATPGLGMVIGIAVASLVLRPALVILEPRRAAAPAPASATYMELPRDDEPAIAALVRDAASALRLPEPDAIAVSLDTRVLLQHEGRRTVLTIGAPWLVGTSAPQLTIAIAHALLLAQTSQTAARVRLTRERLARARAMEASWRFGAPWREYARFGERLAARAESARLSVADAACVRAFGNEALGDALQAARLQSAFAGFWTDNVGRCLDAGFAPPLLDGWQRLLEQEWVAELSAAGELPTPAAPGERVQLRTPVRQLERELLAVSYPDQADGLVEIEWSAVPTAAVLPQLRDIVAPHALQLSSYTAATLRRAIALPPEGLGRHAWADVVGSALAVALVDAGWVLAAPLSAPLELSDGEIAVDPFPVCHAFADGALDEEDAWASFVAEAGIGELRLASTPRQQVAAADAGVDWFTTAVPPASPVRLTLLRPAGLRRRAGAIVAISLLLGLAVAISLVAAATMAPNPRGRVALVCFGLLLAAGLTTWAVSRVRPLVNEGAIVVSAESVRIEDAGLLRRPFAIPRTAVRAVVVDTQVRSQGQRFPMGPSEYVVPGELEHSEEIGWLWVAGRPTLVPLLGIGEEVPNLALLFTAPIVAPRMRRTSSAGPLRNEAMTGLLLCVADPAAARAAFGPWNLTRAVSHADAQHVLEGFLGARNADVPSRAAGDRDA